MNFLLANIEMASPEDHVFPIPIPASKDHAASSDAEAQLQDVHAGPTSPHPGSFAPSSIAASSISNPMLEVDSLVRSQHYPFATFPDSGIQNDERSDLDSTFESIRDS